MSNEVLGQMFKFFRSKSKKKKLSEVDSLYQETISKLPLKQQIEYCQRTIKRSIFDLNNTNEKEKRKDIQRIIDASKHELFILFKLTNQE